MLFVFLLTFPSDLKAQIFGTGRDCTADTDCSAGSVCNTDIGKCQVQDPELGGVVEIRNSLGETGITGTENFGDLVLKYVNFSLPYLALAAFVGFIYAGFLYVTAYGSDEQIQKSKKVMIYAVVGLLIVILAFAIVQVFTTRLVQSIT